MTNKHKPKAPIIGANGNIYNILAIASRSLQKEGFTQEANEMSQRVFTSSSYDEALQIITEYVEPVEVNQELDYEDQNWE